MPAVEINLRDEEDLIRVYTRLPRQTELFRKLLNTDFARIMHSHSGISLWRLDYCTRQHAMAQIDTEKLKGTAIIKAKKLKDLGLRFFGSGPTDPHVSVRCVGCDLNINYRKELCKKIDGTACGFDLHAEITLCKQLRHPDYFTIDRAIELPR